MKVGLTVTTLLHDVDLVLGINWLQSVNPVVDWSGARLYVPNAVQTALLQGEWLEGHMQSGTVTVLSGEEELKRMKERRNENQIGILKCPKFWRKAVDTSNLRTNFVKGDVKYEVQWGICITMTVKSVKGKSNVKRLVNIKMIVNYM